VEDSYQEQGGSEGVVKVLKDIETVTKQQIAQMESDIARQGAAEYLKSGMHQVQQKGLEVGGVLLDTASELEKDIQKAGGLQAYVSKEIAVVEQSVVPVASQAGAILIEAGSQTGGLLMDKWEKVGKDVEAKGGVDKYLKAETEEAVAKSIELGSVLAAGAAEFSKEAQEKGVQVALWSAWGSISATFAEKPEKDNSEEGFDEETP